MDSVVFCCAGRRYLPPSLSHSLSLAHTRARVPSFLFWQDHVVEWAEELYGGGRENNQFLDGIGYHWYAGSADRMLDGGLGTPNMHRLTEVVRKKSKAGMILGTENCHCPSTSYAGGDLNVAWARAERSAHSLLADLAAGSHGSIEWNLILDKLGGPNHLGNLCDAPLIALPDR